MTITIIRIYYDYGDEAIVNKTIKTYDDSTKAIKYFKAAIIKIKNENGTGKTKVIKETDDVFIAEVDLACSVDPHARAEYVVTLK